MRFIILFLAFFITNLSAQMIAPSSDTGRASTIGYCSSSLCIMNNPSFLTFLPGTLFSLGYARYYEPSYLSSFLIGYARKVDSRGTAGVLWQRISLDSDFGFFDYKENHLFVSYGYALSKYLRPGAGFKVLNMDTLSGTGMGYSLSLSFLIMPLQNLFFSLVGENIMASKFKWTTNRNEEFERSFLTGLGYEWRKGDFKLVASADYLISNLKIKDFVISDDYGHDTLKTGISLSYNFLGLSAGVIKDKDYNYLSGIDLHLVGGTGVGFNYVYHSNELGYTVGVYFEYKD